MMDARLKRIKELFFESEKRNGELSHENFELKKRIAETFDDGYKAGSNYRELGCEGCAFESTEEWEMPCAKCQRNCKDYYRRGDNKELARRINRG